MKSQSSTINDIQRMQAEAKIRLNFTESQYPPDLAYIKADRIRLQSYLDDRERIERVIARGTPRFKQRFTHFGLAQEDADKMLAVEQEQTNRTLSLKDTYMAQKKTKNSYKWLHGGVQKTQDLLEILAPHNTKQKPSIPPSLLNLANNKKGGSDSSKKKFASDALNYNDDRFYAKLKLVEEQVGVAMRKNIEDEMLSKRDRLINDPIEGPKLKQIKESLGPAPGLKIIESDLAEFEAQTDRAFNDNMNTEQQIAEQIERQKFEESEKIRKGLGVTLSPRDQQNATPLKNNKVSQRQSVNMSVFENESSVDLPPGLAQTTINNSVEDEEEDYFYPTRKDFKFAKRKIQPVLDPLKMGLRVSPAKIRMVKQLLLPRVTGCTPEQSRMMMSRTMLTTHDGKGSTWRENNMSNMGIRSHTINAQASKTMTNFTTPQQTDRSIRSFSVKTGDNSARINRK